MIYSNTSDDAENVVRRRIIEEQQHRLLLLWVLRIRNDDDIENEWAGAPGNGACSAEGERAIAMQIIANVLGVQYNIVEQM